MALDKIILSDGATELANVKSVTYKEVVNAGVGLRPGCVGSAQIEVEVYGNQAGAVAAGEVVRYYQIDAGGNETLMGLFTAEPSIETKNSYKFLAYDNAQKLDVDFSQWLQENQENFPMTVYALVSAACTVAGVTLGSSSWPLSTQMVNAFYTDGITCRDILSYAAEIGCRFVRCHTDGAVYFDWYAATANSIGPSVGTNRYAYKQNGLTYANYTAESLARVAVHPSGEDDVAYIYPDGVTSGNTLHIKNNLLLTAADATFYNAVAQNVYSNISTLFPYRPFSVRLFPGENPFRAGMVVSAVDIQGVQFSAPVMSMSVTSAAAELESTGNVTLEDSEVTAKELVQLSSDIVRINKLKVSYADIDQAIINYLTANNVTAQNLTIVDEDGNVLATYDANGARIGGEGSANVNMDSTGFAAYDRGGSKAFEIRMDGVAHPATMDRSVAAKSRRVTIPFLPVPDPDAQSYTWELGSVEMNISDLSSGLPIIDYSRRNLNCARVEFDDSFVRFNEYGRFDRFDRDNAQNAYYTKMPVEPLPEGQSTTTATRSGGASYAMFVDLNGAGLSGRAVSKAWCDFYPNDGSEQIFLEALVIEAVSVYEGTTITFSATASVSEEFYTYIANAWDEHRPTTLPPQIVLDNVRAVLDAHYDATTYAPSLTYGTASGWRGDYSATFGTDLIAAGNEQTVLGRTNIEDTDGNYAFIIGNGTDDSNRSNALTVDWDGNEVLAGGITVGGDIAAAGDLTVTGDIGSIGDLGVGGDVSVTGGLTINGNRDVGAELDARYYAVNDTFSIPSYTPLNGVAVGATEIYLGLITDKSMENISTITVTSMTGWLGGPNGYIDGTRIGSDLLSLYTVAAAKLSNYHLRIRIKKSSAFSNNTPSSAVGAFVTLGFKFT